jgi:type IV pilus assembly protein PilP
MSACRKIIGHFLWLGLLGTLLFGCGDSEQTAVRQQADDVMIASQNKTTPASALTNQPTPETLKPTRRQRSAFSASLNPFVPLVESEAEPQTAPEPRYRRRTPQTALETIGINQLRLTSIFRGRGGPKALLEESDGKGYIVQIGTHIGLRGGRVGQILKDRVIVVEQTEQADGRVKEHRRELHLNYDTQEEQEPREPSAQ